MNETIHLNSLVLLFLMCVTYILFYFLYVKYLFGLIDIIFVEFKHIGKKKWTRIWKKSQGLWGPSSGLVCLYFFHCKYCTIYIWWNDTHGPFLNSPIILLLLVKCKMGSNANGSWTLCNTFNHVFIMSRSLVAARATTIVGIMAIDRVSSTRFHLAHLIFIKP